MEFWFAIIKVLTIIGLIILGIVIDAGGGPNHEYVPILAIVAFPTKPERSGLG